MLNAERKVVMKAKSKIKINKGKCIRAVVVLVFMVATIVTLNTKANTNYSKPVGYVYDTGNTVWEMAEKYVPSEMDIRDFVKEIEKANDIQKSTVYNGIMYKIPVYKVKSEYLDMTTVIGYDATEDGVLLHTDNGNGYFIEK